MSFPTFFYPSLGLLFIGLKLGGAIDWSWWWVLSPLWGAGLVWLIAQFVVQWIKETRAQRWRR